MKSFVVYEVWTRSRVVEAESHRDAYDKGQPEPQGDGWSLCNWHAVACDGTKESTDGEPTGALNYQQLKPGD